MHGRAESQVTLASRSSAVEKAMQMEIQKVRAPANVLLGGEIVGKDDGFSCSQFHKRLINSSHTPADDTMRKLGVLSILCFTCLIDFPRTSFRPKQQQHVSIIEQSRSQFLLCLWKMSWEPVMQKPGQCANHIQRFPFSFSPSKRYLELRNFTYSHGVNLTNQTLLNEKSINHQNHMVAAM